MSRLDRYVLGSFLRDYLISFAVLVGLFILLDMVFNFDDFTRHMEDAAPWLIGWAMLRYYFYQSFFVYAQLAGVIPVLAAAFTLMRMSRFNELTALLAAGVPLLRVAAPVIIAAVGINLVVQPVNQELLIPNLLPNIIRDRTETVTGLARAFPVRAMPDGRGGIFDATRFHPEENGQPAWLEMLTVVRRDEAGRVESVLAAERAWWDEGRGGWRLERGQQVADLADAAVAVDDQAARRLADAVLRGGETVAEIDFYPADISPAEIELFRSADIGGIGLGGSYYDLLSTRQMNALLDRPDRYGSIDLVRAKHTRLSQHVMNLVLMLLAIPAVLTRQPGQLRRAAGKTLLLVGSAMGATFLCQMIAREAPGGFLADRWPALMSWMPVFIFGPLAVVLLDRIKS